MFQTNDINLDELLAFDVTPNKRPLEVAPESSKRVKIESFKSPPVKKVVQRKFPGPAGLLLERDDSPQNSTKPILCSQATVNLFNEGPWLQMLQDFKEHEFDRHTIDWIKLNQSQLVKRKVPALVAVIGDVEFPKVTLRDSTGEICGLLDGLDETYKSKLLVGSVVVLQLVRVLTMERESSYVLITKNGLRRIYYRPKGDRHSEVKVATFSDFSIEDIFKSSEDWNLEQLVGCEDVFQDAQKPVNVLPCLRPADTNVEVKPEQARFNFKEVLTKDQGNQQREIQNQGNFENIFEGIEDLFSEDFFSEDL